MRQPDIEIYLRDDHVNDLLDWLHQAMGPLTLEARATALAKILDIQSRARVDLINTEEEARIRELIAMRTFPDKWDGSEPSAAAWLDRVNQDGSVEPILFREMVGS